MVIATEVFLTRRYLTTNKEGKFSLFLSMVCVLGISLAITVLITIMSIMNGFEQEITARTVGTEGHFDLRSNVQSPENYAIIQRTLEKESGIDFFSEILQVSGYLVSGKLFAPAMLRSFNESDARLRQLMKEMTVAGDFSTLNSIPFSIAIGKQLANYANLEVGDDVTLVLSEIDLSPIGLMPKVKKFKIVSLFEFGDQEIDGSLVYVNGQSAKLFFGNRSSDKLLKVWVGEGYDEKIIQNTVKKLLDVETSDWKDKNSALAKAMRLEKLAMFILLLMAGVVAILNMTSIFVVDVIAKRKNIAVLNSLGMSTHRVMLIFILKGLTVGFVGLTLGLLGGVALSSSIEKIIDTIETALRFNILAPDVFYVSTIPSNLLVADLILVFFSALIMILISVSIPAVIIYHLKTLDGLKNG